MKFSYAFDDTPFIKFLAKLWTIPSTFRTETCVLCQNMYTNQFQHAVLGCPCTRHIIKVIDNFGVHLYIELSQLDEELMYFVLLGGVQPTTILDENEKKNVFAFVQKLFVVQQHTIVELLHKLCKTGCLLHVLPA